MQKGSTRRGLLTGGRIDVFDDEQCLSRAHETQLAARDLLDRRRVFPQPPSVFPQPRVFGPKAGEIGSKLIILFASPHRGDQSLIADQRVDDEDAHGEEEQPAENAAPAALRAPSAVAD